MMIYLIRHAQSVMNTKPTLVGGRSNETKLTKLGIRQAKELGAKIKLNPDLDLGKFEVYSSTAIRAKETAKLALQAAGLVKTEIKLREDLVEFSAGRSEGKRIWSIGAIIYALKGVFLPKKAHFSKGESIEEVEVRIREALEQIAAESKAKNILVFTHGMSIKCLIGKTLGWGFFKIWTTPIENTSTTKLKFNGDGQFEVLAVSCGEF
jgi:alpha-ribazole phosphatase